jgi:K+-transporting ATPase ATPase A chain
LIGAAMWVGRFGVILPALAIAGSMAGKPAAPPSAGTFPTDGPLFTLLLVAVIVIVGALTFFPALTLGPLVEHLLMQGGRCSEVAHGSHAKTQRRKVAKMGGLSWQ